MEFGYFTLSDNHYPDNRRSANQFVLEIREQAILADRIGMHSCWIGEHHFDSLGVNSRPDILLADRSEEHTSELQSRGHLVCRLLLEKKNKNLHPSDYL